MKPYVHSWGKYSFLQKCIPCLRICINHVQTCGRCLLRENKETLLNKWWFYCKLFYCLFSLPWKINLGNNIFSNLSKERNMPFSKEWDARSNLIAILKPLRSDHCPVQRLQTAAWQFWSIPWQKSCHLSRWQCISQMLERSVRTYTHPSHVRWPDMVSSIEPLSHRKREDGNSWLASDSWNECSNGRAWGAHPRYQTMFYGVWECHALGVHWSRAASGISVF